MAFNNLNSLFVTNSNKIYLQNAQCALIKRLDDDELVGAR